MLGFNMTKVYEQVDPIVLPDEYFPDDYDGPSAGTEAQIVGKPRDFISLLVLVCTKALYNFDT